MRLSGLVSLALWATLAGAAPQFAPPPPNIVDVGYAKYLGNLSFPNAVAYLGVPYAEPPVGNRRFRAPLALNTARVAWETKGRVVDATNYPDFCIQGTTGKGEAGGAGSEDCLKVNIYTPAGARKGDNLPVLVYIHGGGYVYGNPRNWPFDHWIHQSPNVVVVSVYYRLNSFGFLSTSSSDLDLNAGFQDQIQALRWVQQHISAFGGNPRKVTINGESAGGSSVELHLVSPASRGLFSQAILQSVYRAPVPTPKQQTPLFDFFAEHAGCGSARISAKSRLACLRKASVSALARAQDTANFNFTGPYNAFHPVVDGKVLTQIPTLSILQNNFANVPLVVGSTSNETLSGTGTDIGPALKKFFPALDDATLAKYAQVYGLDSFESDAQRYQVATGESELICARHIIAQAASRNGKKAFAYRYNQPVPTSGRNATGHAAENWMMFLGTSTGFNGSTTFQPQGPRDVAFAQELIAYWLSFVRAGDPNAFKLRASPVWPAYSARARGRVALQEGATGSGSGSNAEVEDAAESTRCEFVAGLARIHQA